MSGGRIVMVVLEEMEGKVGGILGEMIGIWCFRI